MSQMTRAEAEAMAHAQIKEFAVALKHVRRAAGDTSIRTLARRTGHSASTLNRAIGGTKFPRWDVVHAYLRKCNVDQHTVDTHWQPKWVAIANMLDPLETLDEPVSAPFGEQVAHAYAVCPICGALVANPELHEQWHQQFVPRRLSVAG